jgi:hypothetical protein
MKTQTKQIDDASYQIESCPFCKGAAMLFRSGQDSHYYVTCVDEEERCKVISSTIPCKTAHEAISTWNNRGTILLCH